MRLFYLTLLMCLAVAALAVGRAPLLLAAGPGGGPGGPPPAWNGQDNATRPGGPGQGGPGGPPPGMGGGSGMQNGQGGQNGHAGPPNREALVSACSGKSAGDDCSFAGPRGNAVNGQCATDRAGDALVCRPQHNPGQNREQGHPNNGGRVDQDRGQQHNPGQNREALVAACSGKSAGDACGFSGPRGNELNGQCVQSRQGNELVCHPQRQ